MNNDLDINIVIQCFNEKISQMMTEIIVKEATIKQLNIQIQQLNEIQQLTENIKTTKVNKTDKSDDFK